MYRDQVRRGLGR